MGKTERKFRTQKRGVKRKEEYDDGTMENRGEPQKGQKREGKNDGKQIPTGDKQRKILTCSNRINPKLAFTPILGSLNPYFNPLTFHCLSKIKLGDTPLK